MINNRQIKFRVWDREDKKWIKDLVSFCSYYNIINGTWSCWDSYYKNLTKNFVFQQFIGLLDKDGGEIYEGDILEYIIDSDYINAGRYICVIEWYHAGFRAKDKSNFGEMFVGDKMKLYPSIEDGKIIGNIFENLELLKKTKKLLPRINSEASRRTIYC